MKNILTAALALAASVCSALDPGVDAARRGSLTSNHSVVTNVSAVRLVGPLADTPLVEGGRTNRLLTTASAGVRNPFALRYGLASSYLSYVGSSSRGLFFGDGLSFSSDGTNGTVSVDSAYLAGLGFAKAANVAAELSRKQGSLSPGQLAAADSGVTAAKVASYDAHVADGAGHVTAAQKAEWSAKQDALTPAQTNAADSGITQAKRETYDGYGTLISRLQAVKVDAADVYTRDEIELVVLRNLVQATITNHLSSLTWDDSYRVMWRKTADAGAFYERACTNVNVIVTGGGR